MDNSLDTHRGESFDFPAMIIIMLQERSIFNLNQ